MGERERMGERGGDVVPGETGRGSGEGREGRILS